MRCPRRLLRLWRHQEGVTALEFAIVAPLFFVVLFLTVEVSFMLFADATLETAAGRITRMGKIGMFVGEDCQQAVTNELEKTLGIWADRTNVHVNAKIYHPGQSNAFEDEDDEYDPVCDTGGRGDMVIFRLGFDKPGLTGILGMLGVSLFHFERIVIIQNEP